MRGAPRDEADVAGTEVEAPVADPLTQEEIATYHEQGFLFPIRVLTDEQVEKAREALDDHLEGRRQSQQYELTDPIVDSSHGETQATVGSGMATAVAEDTKKQPHSVPFLFNLWERDERFWEIDANPVIAGMARQLLGSEGVVLMEDGAVVKKPVVGGKLAWHQDYAYWPIATPGRSSCMNELPSPNSTGSFSPSLCEPSATIIPPFSPPTSSSAIQHVTAPGVAIGQ